MSFEMPQQEVHTMEFVESHKNGQDELYCPTCGRRMLLSWPPNYKKVILEMGNAFAVHTAGRGGIKLEVPQVLAPENQDEADDPGLEPWITWMKQIDFEHLWDQDLL